MPAASESDLQLEIGHVLLIDIVGYSKLLITEQRERLQALNEIVRNTAQFRASDANRMLVRIPTGDGMALIFRDNLEAPARCAFEISQALRPHPEIRLRMGIHSGPVSDVRDVNERANIAGAGMDIAQRVMDCGDAGHILLSKRVADDLEPYPRWNPYLHDMGECEVKHGVKLSLVNLYTSEIGNPQLPEKLKKAQEQREAAVAASRRPTLRRKRVLIAAAVVLIAAISMGIWFYLRQANITSLPPEKSIAVLPFENLSDEKANAYFAAGIQDEILTRLSKIAALKVISRTSTQKYKSAPDNLRDIGKQLGVATLLEGSVQKVANAAHVNVKLIRAATDEHLWAESYDRELQNIFGVEGEVAGKIAEALNAKLTGAEEKALADKPTTNLAAYDAYLHGRSIEATRFDIPGEQRAAADYATAVRLDPAFALAWSHLASVRSFLYFNAIDRDMNSPAAVKEAADHAFALQPELGEAWIAQGSYLYLVLHDFPRALQAFEEAAKRLPNSADAFGEMAFVERRMGRWDASVAHFQKALELDPRNLQLLIFTGETLGYLRRFAEAKVLVDRALQIAPDAPRALLAKASLLQAEGRLDDAAQPVGMLPPNPGPLQVSTKVLQIFYERRFDAVIAQLQPFLVPSKSGEPLDVWKKALLPVLGYCQQRVGKTAEAHATYELVIQEIKPSPEAIVLVDQTFLPCALALAYAGLGDKDKALAQAREAVLDYQDDCIDKPQAEIVLAQVEAQVGDVDAAIAALPHLLEVPAGITPGLLRIDPMWDPLRKDPRFAKLIAEPQSK
jgi:TolB-like protein